VNAELNISGGIVPGFPEALPGQLENAWLALMQHPKEVAISVSPIGEAHIEIKQDPKVVWMIGAMCSGMGAACLIAAWIIDHYRRSDDYDLPFSYSASFKLWFLGWMCLGMGIMVVLIAIASRGKNRDTIIEVSRGRLKVDRWVSGDHVVREYAPEEISMIWTDGAIEIGARLGEVPVAPFAQRDIQDAVAEIVGTVFWGDESVIQRDVKTRTVNRQTRIAVRQQTKQLT
jgi:hypothetical protein